MGVKKTKERKHTCKIISAAQIVIAGLLFTVLIFLVINSNTSLLHASDIGNNTDSSSSNNNSTSPNTAEYEMLPANVGVVQQANVNELTEDGLHRGADAEYCSKIAQYGLLDLSYYYYDNFTDLMNALEKGEIDMTFGIAHTDERDQKFLFSDNYLGVGEVDIKVRPDNDSFEYGDFGQIMSLKLGCVEGSALIKDLELWAQKNGLTMGNVTFYSSEDTLKDALYNGEVDGVITSVSILPECRTIFSVPSKGYYVCFNESRMDLKLIVDSAMNRILYENPDYYDVIKNKNADENVAATEFTAKEKEYLKNLSGGEVIVAVVEYDPPLFRMIDGSPQGIIPSYYDVFAQKLSNYGFDITFSYKTYENEDEAARAVADGEARVLGMTHMDTVIADTYGLILGTDFNTEIIAMVSPAQNTGDTVSDTSGDGSASNSALSDEDTEDSTIKCAVTSDDYQILSFYLGKKAGNYELSTYDNIEKCLKAVESGEQDCMVASLVQATWLLNQYKAGVYSVTAMNSSGWALTAAVGPADAILGSVISKTADSISGNLDTIIIENSAPDPGFISAIQRMSTAQITRVFLIFVTLIILAFMAITYIVMSNIQRKKNEELIESQNKLLDAYKYDHLTGLYSRNAFMDIIDHKITEHNECAMFMVDIDDFRLINESYGHFIGDEVLKEVASKILEYAGGQSDNSITARYSGDEFIILTIGKDNIKKISQNMSHLVKTEHIIDNPGSRESDTSRIILHFSAGAYYFSGDSDLQKAVHNCVIAISVAKKNQDNKLCVFSDSMKKEIEEYNEISDKIREAIVNDGFMMVYQPQVDIRKGCVTGYEALIRMKDSNIGPSKFIPIAEEEGYINQLGRIATRLVIEQLAKWKAMGKELLPVSVNYSSSQVGDREYVDYTFSLLKDYDIPTNYFELEITESLMMHSSEVTDSLFRELKASGIKILMDDFGTGYSSLSYLTYIPVDTLKLDKSFVDACLVDSSNMDDTTNKPNLEKMNKDISFYGIHGYKDNSFIRDIIRLAHDLGKLIIVEGVEEKWQLTILKELGCDMIQGYYFSKPLPADEAIEYRV